MLCGREKPNSSMQLFYLEDRTGAFWAASWSLCCLLNEWKFSVTRREGTPLTSSG